MTYSPYHDPAYLTELAGLVELSMPSQAADLRALAGLLNNAVADGPCVYVGVIGTATEPSPERVTGT